MGNRVVYGNTESSNGWPMVDEGSCTWVDIPGTNPTVHIQIQNGQPLAILRAFVADINAYVEHVRDADTACWTAGNSVSTSNHLSGTAVDIDWESHPFRVADAGWSPDQITTIEQIQDFYEGTVFWGNEWSDPKDAMHFQLSSLANGGDINTYGNPDVQKFIDRKIRADGFSTFRRGGSGGHLPLSAKDGYALAIINEGKQLGITPKGITIALATSLVETNLTMYANRNIPASLNLPHDAVGADHDSTGLFQQRQAWGPLSETMDPTLSARLFFLGGHAGQRGLTDFDYNSDDRTPGGWAQAVQVSAFPDRYDERMGDARAIYDRLANTTPDTSDTGDDMAQVPQDQWDRVYRELTQKLPSRSPLRHLGEGLVDTMAGFVLNMDGSEHVEICRLLAGYGHPPTLALVREVAGADPAKYPDRQDDRLIAQAILADVTAKPAAQVVNVPTAASQTAQVDNTRELADAYAKIASLQAENARLQAQVASPAVVYRDQPAVPQTQGQTIGKFIDSVAELNLSDASSIQERATLGAAIKVLSTKNGTDL